MKRSASVSCSPAVDAYTPAQVCAAEGARRSYRWKHSPIWTADARPLGLTATALAADQAARVSVAVTRDLWVLESIDRTWQAAYRIAIQDGAAVVAEVRLYPAEADTSAGEWSGDWLGLKASVPRGGITARLLRKVRLGAHVTEGRHHLHALEKEARGHGQRSALREILRTHGLKRLNPAQRALPRRQGRRDLQRVASIYTAALGRGSATPVLEVAKQLRIKPKAASNAVSAARRRGLLAPTTRGRMRA